MDRTKIILVDDNKYFRKGMQDVLLNFDNVRIVAELSRGEEFLESLNIIEIAKELALDKENLTMIRI